MLLAGLTDVLAAPLPEVATHLSALLARYVPHSTLAILAEDDVEHPTKQHGVTPASDLLTFTELDAVRTTLDAGSTGVQLIQVGGTSRRAFTAVAESGALLVLLDPGPIVSERLVMQLWQIVALRIRQRASEASPDYLTQARVASSVRAEAITELADHHSAVLDALVAVLRSTTLDDRAARQTATRLAASALVQLRTSTDRVRTFNEEPVSQAFERLQDDLRPLVKYRDIDVQFIEPPVDGRALPSEVAHGARAVVRGAILALVDQPAIGKVRVQWDCDGRNLLIDVRDDGPGELSVDSAQLQPLAQRVLALNGEWSLDATVGWGTEMSVVLPLDPPPVRAEENPSWDLRPRELEVLEHLATGQRYRSIAASMGISENTVKFHVSKVFRKLGVGSRAEAVAIAFEHRAPFA
ncbi:DNA-binding NarL/FixJ family response regulator [Salinibacterium sp. CAN_S4]|uniref:helix-turn-helix transcriptional regulator n=1 Tax=Salinibacterium sp. CAN_S4 TaxID=2787727 RepID=UPI0018F016EA